jgi:hypothetical protein
VNIVFPIVALPNPRGPWFVHFWIYIISESFHVNMTYYGSVVMEKKIFKWPHPSFAFSWLSPLWRGPGPLFEQFRISINKDDLYQVWLKLASCFWRKRFFKNFSVFLFFWYYLPLEKGNPLHLNNLESPLPKDDLCQVWLKLAQ